MTNEVDPHTPIYNELDRELLEPIRQERAKEHAEYLAEKERLFRAEREAAHLRQAALMEQDDTELAAMFKRAVALDADGTEAWLAEQTELRLRLMAAGVVAEAETETEAAAFAGELNEAKEIAEDTTTTDGNES